MARRSKEQIRQEKLVERLCNSVMSGEGNDMQRPYVSKSRVSDRNITKGVPELKRAYDMSVCLPPGFKRCQLCVVHDDGMSESHPISKRLAALLIARGVPYQG